MSGRWTTTAVVAATVCLAVVGSTGPPASGSDEPRKPACDRHPDDIPLPPGAFIDCTTGETVGVIVHVTRRDLRSMGVKHYAHHTTTSRGTG